VIATAWFGIETKSVTEKRTIGICPGILENYMKSERLRLVCLNSRDGKISGWGGDCEVEVKFARIRQGEKYQISPVSRGKIGGAGSPVVPFCDINFRKRVKTRNKDVN
jgi:hypothetical protein